MSANASFADLWNSCTGGYTLPTATQYRAEVLRLEQFDPPAARRYTIRAVMDTARFHSYEGLEALLRAFPFEQVHGQHCYSILQAMKTAIVAKKIKLDGWKAAIKRAKRSTRKLGWSWRERRKCFGPLA